MPEAVHGEDVGDAQPAARRGPRPARDLLRRWLAGRVAPRAGHGDHELDVGGRTDGHERAGPVPGDGAQAAHEHLCTAQARTLLERWGPARDAFDAALECARRAGTVPFMYSALGYRGLLEHRVGNLRAAEADLARALDLAKGRPHEAGMVRALWAAVAADRGRLDEARALTDQARGDLQGLDTGLMAAHAFVEVDLACGRVAEAAEQAAALGRLGRTTLVLGRALIDHGAALRRAKARKAAREPLAEGLELAGALRSGAACGPGAGRARCERREPAPRHALGARRPDTQRDARGAARRRQSQQPPDSAGALHHAPGANSFAAVKVVLDVVVTGTPPRAFEGRIELLVLLDAVLGKLPQSDDQPEASNAATSRTRTGDPPRPLRCRQAGPARHPGA